MVMCLSLPLYSVFARVVALSPIQFRSVEVNRHGVPGPVGDMETNDTIRHTQVTDETKVMVKYPTHHYSRNRRGLHRGVREKRIQADCA